MALDQTHSLCQLVSQLSNRVMVFSGALGVRCHESFLPIILRIKIFVATEEWMQQQRHLNAFNKSPSKLFEFWNVNLDMQHSDYSSSHKQPTMYIVQEVKTQLKYTTDGQQGKSCSLSLLPPASHGLCCKWNTWIGPGQSPCPRAILKKASNHNTVPKCLLSKLSTSFIKSITDLGRTQHSIAQLKMQQNANLQAHSNPIQNTCWPATNRGY